MKLSEKITLLLIVVFALFVCTLSACNQYTLTPLQSTLLIIEIVTQSILVVAVLILKQFNE